MKFQNILLVCFFISVLGCIPATDEPLTDVNLDASDPIFQKISDFQDRQNLDSLLLFTNHSNPSYRYMVANALGSIQNISALDSLEKLLRDPVMKVRTTAAFAMGQMRNPKATKPLLDAFKSKDTLDVNTTFNAAILEAIGKVGSENLLTSLASVSTYRSTDTLLLTGQCKAIYEYALRGITRPEGTDKMVQYLTEYEYPHRVKLIAANYLYRAKELDLENYKFRLTQVFQDANDPNLKMVLAIILGKLKDRELLATLNNELESSEDYRVQTNIIRGLSNYPYIQVVDKMIQYLSHDNLHIASTAADFFINNGNRNDALIYRDYISDDKHPTVNAKLYSAILKHLPTYYTNTRNIIKKALKDKIEESTDPIAKAEYLTALGYDPLSYKEIPELSSESKHAIVRSAGANAIANILKSPSFVQTFRSGQRRIKREILALIKGEIERLDAGSVSIYGELLADENVNFKEVVDSLTFLDAALKNLRLPKEIESYNSLAKAKAYLSGNQFQSKTPDWNHPIDWRVIDTYGDSASVAIKTTRGVIRAKLMATHAPGTVVNFLSLVKDDFYDGKTFHRVVPNFVIQGGCPRGDGYGSKDFSIRSELSQIPYDDAGYIGMASAGLHTEGTQFFITHSPTLHLNGKYTIFGKVTEGLDVVHTIQAGDVIEDVIIIN